MVSFVCDACQDVLVKRKLDNHGCGASFSCVDCSVSFPGTSYRTHTSCISEAEKYQKSLYKGKKTAPQANGGPAGSKENGKPSVADESSTKEAVASPSEGKKLSKEEKKKLKSEKKSSEKKDEESKMDVDEAAPQKLSKDEKKKLKAAKETAKVEPASTGEPESLGAQLRKLEEAKAQGKDGSGVSDIAAAAAAAGLSPEDLQTKAQGKAGSKEKKRERKEKAETKDDNEAEAEPPTKKSKKEKGGELDLATLIAHKAKDVLSKPGEHTLASLKKDIGESFASKSERKASGFTAESFDQVAKVSHQDGALVISFV